MTTANITISDLVSKPGLSGIWHTARVAVDNRLYLVAAASNINMISVYTCRSLSTSREAKRGSSVRRAIENAVIDFIRGSH